MDLLKNPFHILAASPRDNRRRIMELADERGLFVDSNECDKARSDLTNPRRRLSAEVAWLPGIGPKSIGEVLAKLETSPTKLLAADKIKSIARANLLAAGLSRLREYNHDTLVKWIIDIAWTFEGIDPSELNMILNEERVVSGFPEVTDLSAVEAEIQERRRYFIKVIKSALDNLPSKELVEVVTFAVESATDNGREHGPILIADLVDAYEVEAQEFLEKEEGNIKSLVGKLRTAVDAEWSDSTLESIVNQLIQVVRNWDTVAQPIQVSTKSRGLDHNASLRVAGLVRGLAIYMFNEHDKLNFSQQLTSMLREVFAEVGEVAEHTADDADVLDEVAKVRKMSSLLEPISDLCKSVIENIDKYPYSADKEAKKIIDAAPHLLDSLVSSESSSEIISQGKDEIALTLMSCAVVYGNETSKWKACVTFLEEALMYATNQEVKSHVQKNLRTVKNNGRLYDGLIPITSAPGLYSINGIGTKLYGETDHDQVSGSYLSTYYFIFFFIPIFPICRYRIIKSEGGYRFLGKSRLRKLDIWHIVISLALISWVVLSM